MSFDWSALGTVAAVGIVATVLLVGLFCGGVAASSREGALARGGAVACFALCGVGVLYGLYLVVPQFH